MNIFNPLEKQEIIKFYFNRLALPSESPQSSRSTTAPSIFSFTPASMISAVKQRSAFAPVMRTSPPPPPNPMALQSGWAHPILTVTI